MRGGRGCDKEGRKKFHRGKKRKVTYTAPDYRHGVSRALSLPPSLSRSRFHPIEITTEVAGRLIPAPPPLCPAVCKVSCYVTSSRTEKTGKDEPQISILPLQHLSMPAGRDPFGPGPKRNEGFPNARKRPSFSTQQRVDETISYRRSSFPRLDPWIVFQIHYI